VHSEPEQLLRRLSIGDQTLLRSVLTPTPEFGSSAPLAGQGLDRQLRALVRVAALLVVGAPTATLHWAVELALSTGASAEAVVDVLVATAGQAGAAQVVSSAPRLALALGFDLELDGWDGA
jgi:4-carboxymuconolactone decarboxylase